MMFEFLKLYFSLYLENMLEKIRKIFRFSGEFFRLVIGDMVG